MNQLFEQYDAEGIQMPYTFDDFRREITLQHLHELTLEERLQGLTPEEVVRALRPEEVVRALRPEEVVRALKPEEVLGRFSLEDRLKGLPLDELAAYLEQQRKQAPGKRPRKPRAKKPPGTGETV